MQPPIAVAALDQLDHTPQPFRQALAPERSKGELYDRDDQLQSWSWKDTEIRIATSPRNALTLVSRRYGIEPSQIVELAPFLFLWAAEASLRQRRERIAEVERAYEAARAAENALLVRGREFHLLRRENSAEHGQSAGVICSGPTSFRKPI